MGGGGGGGESIHKCCVSVECQGRGLMPSFICNYLEIGHDLTSLHEEATMMLFN